MGAPELVVDDPDHPTDLVPGHQALDWTARSAGRTAGYRHDRGHPAQRQATGAAARRRPARLPGYAGADQLARGRAHAPAGDRYRTCDPTAPGADVRTARDGHRARLREQSQCLPERPPSSAVRPGRTPTPKGRRIRRAPRCAKGDDQVHVRRRADRRLRVAVHGWNQDADVGAPRPNAARHAHRSGRPGADGHGVPRDGTLPAVPEAPRSSGGIHGPQCPTDFDDGLRPTMAR